FEVHPEELFTSLGAMKRLLHERGVQRPYLLLSPSAEEDFADFMQSSGEGDEKAHDAVVIGLAPTKFSYEYLNKAFRILSNSTSDSTKPVPLFATHRARYDPKAPAPLLSKVGATAHPPHLAPPILELSNGAFISQTANILNYLAPKLGLDGVTESMTDEDDIAIRSAHVNQLVLTWYARRLQAVKDVPNDTHSLDLNDEAHDVHHPIASRLYYEDQKPESARRAEELRNNRLPKFLAYFALVIRSNDECDGSQGWKYLLGSKMTTADLALFHVVRGLEFAFPRRMAALRQDPAYGEVFAHQDGVQATGPIARYLTCERYTPFSMGIFSDILECFCDLKERSHVVLALSLALPRSPVPRRWLYYEIDLHTPRSALLLYKHLRSKGGAKSTEASWVHAVHSNSWTVDAQILADLLEMLSNVEEVSINIGTTFSPEHSDGIFAIPRPTLKSLSLTFRPYVQEATYYQFLAGAYFDNILSKIASWPSHSQLKHFSIIQTAPPQSFSHFAQPIVFFSLQPLADLARSPALRNTTHFRFNIPGRPIADAIRLPKLSLDAVTLLDLSTTSINPNGISKILLPQFPSLRHLILDECPIVPRSTELTGEYSTLGRLCATSSMDMAREKGKKLKEFAAAQRAAMTVKPPPNATLEKSASAQLSKVKRGRRGLAAPTFSLRDKAGKPESTTLTNSSVGIADAASLALFDKIRILPTQCKLQTICTTVFKTPTQEQVKSWQEEFAVGWMQGSSTLEAVQKRLLSSLTYGIIRLYRFATPEELLQGTKNHASEHPSLEGLVEVTVDGFEACIQTSTRPPRLCFGKMDGVPHAEECGHQIAW
ncbi:hypothetical protein FRC17_008611, partial [Serendipita sp. 399]